VKTTRSSNRIQRIGWVAMTLLAVLAVTALGQNVTNTGTGTITNNGTMKLKGALTPASQGTFLGTVEYNNAGTQTVTPLIYTGLTVSGGTGDKTLGAGTTTVGGVLTVNNTGFAFVVGGQTLALTGASPVTVSAGSFNATSGTVNYSGATPQALFGTTYQNLGASGGGGNDKSAGGAVTATGTITTAASTVIDFQGNTFVGTGATYANSGTLRAGGIVTIDATAAIGGTFEYNRATTTQNVAPAFYTNLTLSGGAVAAGGKFFSGLTKISGVYAVGGANRDYATSTATVEFNGGGAQTITGESNYYAVTLSAAGGKTLASALTLTNVFTHTSGQLDINAGGSLNLGTTASFAVLNINTTGALTGGSGLATFGSATAVTAAGGGLTAGSGGLQFSNTLANAGTITVAAGRAMTLSNTFTNTGTLTFAATSTVTFNQAGAQSVPTASYGNLALAGGNTKSLSGATGIVTALTTSGTTSVAISGGTTTLSPSATAQFDADLTTTGTFDASAATTTTTFSGAAQTISGTPIIFTNLTLSGSADKSSGVGLTVNGVFTPTQGISMTGGSVLAMGASGTVGTYGALKEVKGLMTVNAGAAATYKMNNEFTSVAFSGIEAGRTFTLNNQPITNPFGGYVAATDVNRKVTATYSNWVTSTATVQIAYRFGERSTNGGSENSLRYFRNDPSVSTNKIGTGFVMSRTNSGAADLANADLGRLSLAGVQATGGAGPVQTKLNSGDVIALSARAAAFYTVANTADFNTGATWDEGTVPTATDDAFIQNTAITILTGASNTVKTLTIAVGKDLTLNNGAGGLTASNGLTNNGTLTIGTGRTLDITIGDLVNAGTVTNNGTITVQ
jgi:fibronectin-binding autotransporter adhesin